jgi:methanogenic corrinoid protein MtbC1
MHSVDKNKLLNNKLIGFKSTFPSMILADHFAIRPDMARNYSDYQKDKFQKDVAWILSFLAEAVWAGQPALFEEFISWLKTLLTSLKIPMKAVAESLDLIKIRLNEACDPDENDLINPFLDKAIHMVLSDETEISLAAMENHLSPLARHYLDCLLKVNRSEALSLILGEVNAGVPVKEIYLQVFQPVQYEIGRLWQTNKISVAQEHYCTGATQLVMSQLYPYLFTGEKKNRKMVTTCVSGELHEMGARMVTDFFEMEGWDTYYLGANMPIDGVIKFLLDIKPQILAISATMTIHVSAVEEMIQRIRSTPGIQTDLKIIVGGYPFKVAENLWNRVGADGCAGNALDAVNLAVELITV